MNLGEKIKKLRISKKITQKELAGEKITRNMLSQIESGKASPSLETLEHISNGLNIPIAYFFTDDEDSLFYEKRNLINEIYSAYKNKAYQHTISLINRLEKKDNELYFILTSSHFELGKASLFKGSLITAKSNFDLAEEYAPKTLLNTDHITAIIPMYSAITKNIQAPLLEFDISKYQIGLYATFDYEFFKYLTLDFEYPYENEIFKKHLSAKLLINDRNYQEAIKQLSELADSSIEGTYNAFAIFGIYSDIENCYKQLYDFENAYRFATKRLSLIEGFKS